MAGSALEAASSARVAISSSAPRPTVMGLTSRPGMPAIIGGALAKVWRVGWDVRPRCAWPGGRRAAMGEGSDPGGDARGRAGPGSAWVIRGRVGSPGRRPPRRAAWRCGRGRGTASGPHSSVDQFDSSRRVARRLTSIRMRTGARGAIGRAGHFGCADRRYSTVGAGGSRLKAARRRGALTAPDQRPASRPSSWSTCSSRCVTTNRSRSWSAVISPRRPCRPTAGHRPWRCPRCGGPAVDAGVDPVEQLAERQRPVALEDAEPQRVVRGPPERDPVPGPVPASTRRSNSPEPVREHLGRMGQHLAGTPRGLGLGAEVLGEAPRAARLHPRAQRGEGGTDAARRATGRSSAGAGRSCPESRTLA